MTRLYCTEIRAAIDAAAEAWRADKTSLPTPGWREARAEAEGAGQGGPNSGHLLSKRTLRKEAAEAFAALNGWRHCGSFGVRPLANGDVHTRWSREPHWLDRNAFDHPVFFRELKRPYRTAAIVGQPYSHATVEMGREIAASLGLELHTPPNLNASWHH